MRVTVVAAFTFAMSARAVADTPADQAAKLFEQGRTLATKGDYQRAFDAFTKSYELDRAVGTELNLADCLEHLDQPAKAIELYEDAEKQLTASGKGPQAKFAHDRVTALATKLGSVTISLVPVVPGTTVVVAGQSIAPAAEIKRRLAPGSVTVSIAIPSQPPFVKTIAVTAGGDELITLSPEVPKQVVEEHRDRTRVVIGIGVGAAGVVVLGLSMVEILAARRDYNRVKDDASLCVDGRCTDRGLSEISDAQHRADVSTGIFVGGLALVAAGGVLWYTAPKRTTEHATTIAPMASATTAGLRVSGSF